MSLITKATWAQIRSGAALQPTEGAAVEAKSGLASETYVPAHNPSKYPKSTSNTRGFETGDNGMKLENYKKAVSSLRKSLEDPDVTKALDTLETKGVLGQMDEIEKAEAELDSGSDIQASDGAPAPEPEAQKAEVPSPSDVEKVAEQVVQKHVAPILKALEGIQAGITKMNASPNSELQKAGFVAVGGTPSPSATREDRAPGSSIAKAAGSADSELPDFDALSGLRLEDSLSTDGGA